MILSGQQKRDLFYLNDRRDKLFAQHTYPKSFEFNCEVANVFDDMVVRSIPCYLEVQTSILEWANRFAVDGRIIYDVGCSTGSTLAGLAVSMREGVDLVGIDTSQAMLDFAEKKLAPLRRGRRIDLVCQDALQAEFNNAGLVVVNYTLQFIPVAKRRFLLEKIYENLPIGGLLYLSDKVRSSCAEFQEAVTEIYEAFKATNGYSRNEIERKKEALDNVLIPLSFDEELAIIRTAGFKHVEPVIKWNNFAAFVAIKK